MRLWLLGRPRRARRGAAPEGGPPGASAQGARPSAAPGSHRRTSRPAGNFGVPGTPGGGQAATGQASPGWPDAGQVPARPDRPQSRPIFGFGRDAGRGGRGLARAAIRLPTADPRPQAAPARPAAAARTAASTRAREAPASGRAAVPWYQIAEANRTTPGWRDCGSLEPVLHREWARDAPPPEEAVTAIDRLADLPRLIKDRLAAGLEAIHVGRGGVPDLDDMGRLSGVPLPSGRATWDACAGAYGERKIVVGSRPSPTPDVMCHEVGHALDDIDGSAGNWQSDSAEFRALHEQCLPHLVSNLHRQRGALGRREFFADSFAAIASRQRPALVDMLGGDTRSALNVMLYFNMRYGI